MEFEGRKKVRLFLNITPLIDVVFLLLIFFMLSSHFVKPQGIKINLPKAQTSQPETEKCIIIFISQDNKIYLDHKPVNIKNLYEQLNSKIEKIAEKKVVLKADKKISLGLAVEVIDIARQSKVENLVISTELTELKEK
ncbi:MAG: biopolymer transporter ExbD [Elusimicrobia bacterium]|nr:biopolymer transporter ExbD [Elusimicrobiota bacterium]